MNKLYLKYPLSIFLMILIGFQGFGQHNIIGKNDSHKKEISLEKYIDKELNGLAKAITKHTFTDHEKAFAIYHWITSHIEYDNQLQLDTQLQREIYVSEENVVKNVLERRRALCGGYAFLFKELCIRSGLEAEVVHGFTKTFGNGEIRDFNTPNHTWNAVKLNGKWSLIDLTWAVGYGRLGAPDNFWFLTEPSVFILSHYPEDQDWTLLDNPMTLPDFFEK